MIALVPGAGVAEHPANGAALNCGTAANLSNLPVVTTAALVYVTNLSTVLGKGFVGKFNGTTLGWFMRVLGTLNVVVQVNRAGGNTSFTTTDLPVLLNTWQWFVGQYDTANNTAAMWTATALPNGTTTPMRRNAGTLAAGSGALNSNTAQAHFVGGREPSSSFPGRQAVCAMWGRYLSAADIGGIPLCDLRDTSPLGLWYPGSNGVTGSCVDESGHGNHGLYSGATLAPPAPAGLFARHHGAIGAGF